MTTEKKKPNRTRDIRIMLSQSNVDKLALIETADGCNRTQALDYLIEKYAEIAAAEILRTERERQERLEKLSEKFTETPPLIAAVPTAQIPKSRPASAPSPKPSEPAASNEAAASLAAMFG